MEEESIRDFINVDDFNATENDAIVIDNDDEAVNVVRRILTDNISEYEQPFDNSSSDWHPN